MATTPPRPSTRSAHDGGAATGGGLNGVRERFHRGVADPATKRQWACGDRRIWPPNSCGRAGTDGSGHKAAGTDGSCSAATPHDHGSGGGGKAPSGGGERHHDARRRGRPRGRRPRARGAVHARLPGALVLVAPPDGAPGGTGLPLCGARPPRLRPDPSSYTVFHIVVLLDTLRLRQVFVVGHDWGAIVSWNLCLLRPDRVCALVNLSVAPLLRGG